MPKADARPTIGATGTLAEESTGLACLVRDIPHTRRRLLATAASGIAAATVAGLPAVALAIPDPDARLDELAASADRLRREWNSLIEAMWATKPLGDGTAASEVADELWDVLEEARAIPSAGVRGVLAKVRMARADLAGDGTVQRGDDLLGSAIDDLDRLDGRAAA